MKQRFPQRPDFGPRSPEHAGGDQSIRLTEEDERILDAAAAKRRHERQKQVRAEQKAAVDAESTETAAQLNV
jgi:hypothetical protein